MIIYKCRLSRCYRVAHFGDSSLSDYLKFQYICFELLVHFVSNDRSISLNHKIPVMCFVLLIFRTLVCSLVHLRFLSFKVTISSPYQRLFLSFKFHVNHACLDTPQQMHNAYTHHNTHRSHRPLKYKQDQKTQKLFLFILCQKLNRVFEMRHECLFLITSSCTTSLSKHFLSYS